MLFSLSCGSPYPNKNRRTAQAATPVCNESIKIIVDIGACQEEILPACACLPNIAAIGAPF
jgi:hypothetical protein